MKYIVGNTLSIHTKGVNMNAAAHHELREALPADEDFHKAMIEMIHRHVNGDWGDVSPHDRQVNEQSVKSGARVMSEYTVAGIRLWVISDAAWTAYTAIREVTTILRPEDY